ncbi:DNA-binding protein, partial [archaeon]|nr:DNA-binding protein [archaeon]
MEIHAIRLKPNQDLKEELNKFSKDKNIQAGAILTCVGSLKKLTVRLSNEQVKLFKGNFEI